MTLTEYFNQSEPVLMPHVVLTEADYKTGLTINVGQDKLTAIEINGLSAGYIIKNGYGIVWTTDQDGNPKSPSCFSVQPEQSKSIDFIKQRGWTNENLQKENNLIHLISAMMEVYGASGMNKTDNLFELLPNWVQTDGKMYHFGMIKGLKRIIVWYKQNESEGGQYLGSTSRGGETLRDALDSMYKWLVKFKYI
jgi:hypothetical protein